MHCGPDGHSLSPLGLPTGGVALAPSALADGASLGAKPTPIIPPMPGTSQHSLSPTSSVLCLGPWTRAS